MYHHRARRARWHKLLMTPRGVTTNDETRCPPANRSLTVAAPIDVSATPIRAATVRERLPGVRPAKRGLPPIPAFGIGWLSPVCPKGYARAFVVPRFALTIEARIELSGTLESEYYAGPN